MDMLIYLMRGETCTVCQNLAGRLYTPGTEPQLPIHDRCDCYYENVTIPESGTIVTGDGDPDIWARIYTLERRINRLELIILRIQTMLHDLIAASVGGGAGSGVAGNIAFFKGPEQIIGDTKLTYTGEKIVALAGNIPNDAVGISAQNESTAAGSQAALRASANPDTPDNNIDLIAIQGGAGQVRSGAGLSELQLTAAAGQIKFSHAAPVCTDLPTLLAGLTALGLIFCPPTTPVLDTFNRADEGPPPAGWTNLNGGIKVVSNQAAGSDPAGGNVSYYNTIFGPNCEAHVPIAVLPNVQAGRNGFTGVGVGIKFETSHRLTVTYIRTASSTVLLSICNGITTIASTTRSGPAVGDKIGIRSIGSTVYGLFCPLGGNWEIFASAQHTYAANTGYLTHMIAWECSDARTDDFSGGTL